MPSRNLALLVSACLAAPAALAEPLKRDQVPEPLRPWVDWALRGHEDALCTPAHNGSRRCAWPGRLDMELGGAGGTFAQDWVLQRPGWVPLPGDAKRWPLDLRVDGAPAPVVLSGDAPGVDLPAGASQVAGRFAWTELPQQLPVPEETGMLRLVLRGQAVDFPQRDEAGQLWLARRGEEDRSENRVEVLAHRKVVDEVPLLLVTRIDLQVSGQARDEVLGPVLPAGFAPLALEGPLPARLEAGGKLRVQLRPGTWSLELRARHEGPVKSIDLLPAAPPWPSQEVWVFDARPNLRLAEVEGGVQVDPQQTRLPNEWKRLPSWHVQPGRPFTLAERRRGDSPAMPDELVLRREWTMDFDGRGFTVHDSIGGTLNQGWRLTMAPPLALGRVAVDGQDQFITRLEGATGAGVEVRQRNVNVVADSRLDGVPGTLPAVGWAHDLHGLSGTLRLPPGWRLWHASGVDEASPTWLARWTLLDLFVVLLVVLAAAKLWGRAWGVLALATLALCWQEPGAPRWAWPAVLAGEALLRALPEGRLFQAVRAFRLGALVIIAAIAIPFSVQQLRQGLYPALEKPWMTVTSSGAGGYDSDRFEGVGLSNPLAAPAAAPMMDAEDAPVAGKTMRSKAEASLSPPEPQQQALNSYDSRAVVQTGPGVPRWSWNKVDLRWSGPVPQDQQLELWLTGPAANFALAALRTLLVALLALCAARFPGSFWPGRVRDALSRRPALWALPLLLGLAAPARADVVPPPEMLEKLRESLLEPPKCSPRCATAGRLAVDASADTLRLRLEVDAAAAAAVPLPGAANQWTAQSILVDGAPAKAAARSPDGTLWLLLDRGRHQLTLEGRFPPRESVQLPLPLRPHHVQSALRGWTLDGVHDGHADEVLRFTRLSRHQGDAAALEQGALPPFVQVQREVSLGLSWSVLTRVSRVSPLGAAVVVEVPLLPGERVTSADVRVNAGRAVVNLGPQATAVAWSSALDVAASLLLQAPASVPWTEVWRLDAGPTWHLQVDGIPTAQGGGGQRAWWPWPGESVTVSVTRPEGVGGSTTTVDSASIHAQPGARATDVSLSFTARTSRGGPHVVTIPEGAALQEATINGVRQFTRAGDAKVSLPLGPGTQSVQLRWRQGDGMGDGSVYRLAGTDLGAPAVNVETVVDVPANRWVLAVQPAQVGPAVLFWSLLTVVLLVALGLGRTTLAPLRWQQWFLLGVGLTQGEVETALLVAGWLLALGWRRQRPDVGRWFNPRQVALALWSLAALVSLVGSVAQGLLGSPQMHVAGNGSSSQSLHWYADRSAALLPQPWVFSVPLWAYRVVMLAWALWLAFALLEWLRWGYSCLSEGGLWRWTPPGGGGATPAAPGSSGGSGTPGS